MGKEIEKIFKVLEEKAGNNGRLKFSETTKLTRARGKLLEDRPELVEKLKVIASRIIGSDINEFMD